MIKPIVVIPVHKKTPDAFEITSIIQCHKVLQKHEITYLAPLSLDMTKYFSITHNNRVYRLPDYWMSSIEMYNKLMISNTVFNAFRDYSHILIHEPDSIVLENNLDSWCRCDIDYIGAPWLMNKDSKFVINVGNFGLSLINIQSAIKVFESNKKWYSYTDLLRDQLRLLRGKEKIFDFTLKNYHDLSKFVYAYQNFNQPCDIFWSYLVPKKFPKFKIASPNLALQFSWERYPEDCFRLNGDKLPFGLHAWYKYNPNYIIPILESKGIQITKF